MLCGAGEWSDGVREQWSTEKPNAPTLQHSMVIVYHDDDIVVICKPSGLLSVPGKGPENQDCVAARVKEQFPDCPDHPEVHRLDMDTSGLMVLTRTKEAHRELSRQFHDRETQKRYIALLDGELPEESGTIKLPFRLDVDNRPMQIYDPVHGKLGITHWRTLALENGKTRVEFIPITGRTHQLRVHAASEHGLGTPIVGDRLYGTGTAPGQLKLHAAFLSFTHPTTGKKLEFKSEPDF
ncbi:MAG: RluA family pseudouridine synthase [Kiritimatiellales bacterium]|nr:RluA family pseudouridine synthase [Kiritimatiellota bacterium]MBL7011483.1 RluA family pseudouridine synthase [Kiritimatiellales bacterium]